LRIEQVSRRLILSLLVGIALIGAGWWVFLREPELYLPKLDRIVVHKAERRMELFARGRLVHTLTGIQLGDAPEGHKHFEGDEKTPEGRYTIDLRNPRSSYHLSLRISYPDAAAKSFAATQQRSPGGEIYIHGQPNGLWLGRMMGDWTDGCVALSNREIEALWRAVPVGTAVEILP
jgi:murein L,D-transpeptidase YafK